MRTGYRNTPDIPGRSAGPGQSCRWNYMFHPEKALLNPAAAKGFKDLSWMRRDTDFKSIRTDRRFKTLSGG